MNHAEKVLSENIKVTNIFAAKLMFALLLFSLAITIYYSQFVPPLPERPDKELLFFLSMSDNLLRLLLAGYIFYCKGESKLLKYLVTFSFYLLAIRASYAANNINWLIFTLPIFFSTRYYSPRLTLGTSLVCLVTVVGINPQPFSAILIPYTGLLVMAMVTFFTACINLSGMNAQIEAEQQLQEALLAAEQANRAKTAFLNNMSHDMRTPMNAIVGFTGLAMSRLDKPEVVKEYLTKITTSSNHLLSLINDVLDMSRIESGRFSMDRQELNLPDMLQELRAIFQTDAAARRLSLSFVTQNLCHSRVITDRLCLTRVLMNIIGNALKYTPAGGSIEVQLTEQPFDEGSTGFANYIFSIKDTGLGMSEDFLKNIFEPFSREETAGNTRIQGTGLGMAITKNIVDLLGGTIEAKSKLGEGTEFVVSLKLPVLEELEQTEVPQVKAAPQQAPVSFAGKRLLLVEDNELNQEIAVTLLEEEGFCVTLAKDGAEAVELVQREAVGYFDTILMDIQMPHMNGYEATRAIRSYLRGKDESLPIIAMTANAFEEDRQQAFEAGMNEFCSKPIDVKELFATLERVLKKDK